MSVEIRVRGEHEWDPVGALIDDAFAPAQAPGRLAERIRDSDAWIPDLSLVAAHASRGRRRVPRHFHEVGAVEP